MKYVQNTSTNYKCKEILLYLLALLPRIKFIIYSLDERDSDL